MRASQETDRTQVPSRISSPDRLDPLTEKPTNMSNPSSRQRSQVESTNPPEAWLDINNISENTTSANSVDGERGDKDLEKGRGEDDTELPNFEEGTPEEKQRDPNLVEWDGPDDPGNPMNWPNSKKWLVTIVMGSMTFCITFASSVFSNATMPTAALYHVSTEVTTLGTSLFVLGFAVGPLVSYIKRHKS